MLGTSAFSGHNSGTDRDLEASTALLAERERGGSTDSGAPPHRRACRADRLETTPYWDMGWVPILGRFLIECGGNFIGTLVSLLLLAQYDTSDAPMSASLAPALCYLALTSAFPTYSFVPSVTLADAIMPITPIAEAAPPPPVSAGRTSLGGARPSAKSTNTSISSTKTWAEFFRVAMREMLKRLCRAVLDIIFQGGGAALASLLVWRCMLEDGTGDRVKTHVRSDISAGATLGYMIIYNVLFAAVLYAVRFNVTFFSCEHVQRRKDATKLFIVAVAFFLLTSAATAMFGVGAINGLLAIGPAIATGSAPSHFGEFIFAQFISIFAVALFFRFVVFAWVRQCKDCFELHAN